MVQKQMVWDLAQMVKSAEPALVQKEMETAVSDAEEFRRKYQGKIAKLDSKGLLKMIEERDQLALKSEGALTYAYWSYMADPSSSQVKTLYDSYKKNSSKIGQFLAFMDIELGKLLAQKQSVVSDPALAEYKHKLERVIRRTPHMLSEAEESLTIVKDTNGVSAWQQLQSDWLSTRTFNIELDGKMKTLPYGQIIGLYENSDRDVRKRANQIVYENLGKDDIVWASAIRAVFADHLEMCKLRRHPSPVTQSLIDNDIDQKTLDSLIKTIEANVGLYRSYLKLKAQMMGLKKLANYDIMAPLPKVPEREFSWEEARNETIAAYQGFDDQVGTCVKEMFDRYHIDGEIRKGKTSGAWCIYYFNGKTAFVLLSFNKKLGDVFTLAHENGHAAHAYLGSRAQKLSNFDVGACVAECGSIFGELLLTKRLLSNAKSKQEKQAVLIKVLDEFGMTAFQVSGRFFFEKSLYEAIEREEFLDGETISKYWMAGRDKIYGDAVEWLDVMKWEWTMKQHYYIANYRFYNYPYVFAQAFVYSLYRLYEEEGKKFVPKLKALLSAGSSKSPFELGKELGFDIDSEAFWQKGMDQAAEFIKMLRELQ